MKLTKYYAQHIKKRGKYTIGFTRSLTETRSQSGVAIKYFVTCIRSVSKDSLLAFIRLISKSCSVAVAMKDNQ